MSDDPTNDLSDSEKLDLILSELSDLRTWRVKVDAFIEDRGRDTRPKLELIHKELADARLEFRGRLEKIESKLDVMTGDVMDVRAAQRILAGRLSELEQKRM